jgi:hypothetical protein
LIADFATGSKLPVAPKNTRDMNMAIEIIDDPEVLFNECLRMEQGWRLVARGLGQVLVGYGVLFVGTVIGFGLVTLAMFTFQAAWVKGGLKVGNGTWWELYLGLGILKVIWIISLGIIIGGQFKCMLHAAERHGTRWFMFLCTACLFLGPMFQVAAGIAGWQAIGELRANPAKFRDVNIGLLAQRLMMTGFAISILYPLCFTLFLRGIAKCLRSPVHVVLINIFLVFAGTLVAATMWLLYKIPMGGHPVAPQLALGVFAAWPLVLVIYVVLIAVTRMCILSTMSRVKSPLEL